MTNVSNARGIAELGALKRRLVERLDAETNRCELEAVVQEIDIVETQMAHLKACLSVANFADALAKAGQPAGSPAPEIQLDLFEGVSLATESGAGEAAGAESC